MPYSEKDLLYLIQHHENKFVEFKEGINNPNITRVMCSFFTTKGGILFIGVDDDGIIVGLLIPSLNSTNLFS